VLPRALPAMLAVLATAGLLAGAADACEIAPGVAPRGRLEATGIVVVFATAPPVVEVGRHFTVDARVCAEGTPPVLVRVDAHMPEHRHGMNYRPTLTAKDDGRWTAEGLLFHMPGRWRLTFDVEHGRQRARLFTDIVLE
jgi:hypothetical protein